MYDQVRGERINADVPVSEADPHEVEYFGKHRLGADATIAAAVCGSSPGPGADLVEDLSGFATGDSECVGRHRADAPVAAVCGSSSGPGADLVEGWSWFETGERGRAVSATVTQPVRSLAGTPGSGDTPAANQQAGADPRTVSEQAGHAPLRPPVHARDRQRPGALGASRDAKAGLLETLTVAESAEPDHDRQLLDPSPCASISGQR